MTQSTHELEPWQWTEDHWRKLVHRVRAGRTLRPVSWKDGARCAVALSFDSDHESNELRDGGKSIGRLCWGQYGNRVGVPRILRLLERYDVPATFYVAGVADLVDPQMVPEIVKRKHEVGLLGWSDENVASLDDAEEESRLLMRAVERLTKSAGRRPVGARGPAGTVSRHTLGILKNAGVLYDSSLQSRDEPYELLLDGQTSGLVELPNNVYRNDQRFLTSGRTGPGLLPSPELIFESFRDDFDVAYREGTLFVLTLHPHVVGMRSRIIHLDRLVEYIKAKPGVWFATGEQIARHVKQQAGVSD